MSPLAVTAAVDVALAARRRLAGVSACRSVLGPAESNTADTVWLFVETMQVVAEGTGRLAAVLSIAGGWGRPNFHNTARFPRLRLEIFADPSRDSAGAIVAADAEGKAWAAWEPFNLILHRVDAFAEVWGVSGSDPGTRVWGSQLLGHPDVDPINDWDHGRRLTALYGLNVG